MKTFKEILREAYNELPEKYLRAMENIELIVEDRTWQKGKFSKHLLGLYEGVPLTRRGGGYTMVLPDRITLFQRNIEEICTNEEELSRQIKRTLIHELGHYFGMSEKEVRKAMGEINYEKL